MADDMEEERSNGGKAEHGGRSENENFKRRDYKDRQGNVNQHSKKSEEKRDDG